jgi:thiamine transporter ThiT
MVKDCKPVFLADILSVDFRSRCQQQVVFSVFEAMFEEGVCRWPFSYCLCGVIFKLCQAVDVQKKKMANLVFDILSCLRGHFVPFYLSFVLGVVFFEIYQT